LTTNRRKASSANYFFGLTQVFFITLNGIVLVPLYLQQMSMSLYGAWLAAGSVLTVLTVVDMGLNVVLTHQLAGLLALDDLRGYATTAFTGAIGIVLAGGLIVIMGIALALVMPTWFQLTGPEVRQLTVAMVLASLAAGFSTIAQTWGALPQAAQRTVGMGIVGNASLAIWIAATVLGLSARLGVIALGLGLLARATFLVVGYLMLIVSQWRMMRAPRPMFSRSVFTDLVRRSTPVFLSKVGSAAGQNAEPAITALVISPTAAAILSISSRLAMVVRMIVGPIGSAVFASVSHVYSGGGTERTREVLKMLFFVSNVLLAIGLGATMAFNGALVSLWVGPDKYGGNVLTLLIVLSTAASVAMSLNMNFLQSMGHFRDTSLIDISEIPLRLLLMIALGVWIGIEGMVLAGLIATLSVKGWAYPRLLARSLQVSNRSGALMVVAGAPYIGLGIGLAIAWLQVVPAATDWLHLGIQFGAYTLLISALILITGSDARKLTTAYLAPEVARIRKVLSR
jgi:O-antigen/teichoic acid export membrane protein